MKPMFPRDFPARPAADDRSELARLRLYVKQLEAKLDGVAPCSDFDIQKLETVLKVGNSRGNTL